MARRPRGLTDDERRLWSSIARTAEPLAGRPQPKPDGALPEPRKSSRLNGESNPNAVNAVTEPAESFLKHFEMGSASRKPASPNSYSLAEAPSMPLRMDPHKFKRLKKGLMLPEARIDLHGMTLAMAQPALAAFLIRSHSRGLRLTLVITGKGRGGNGDAGPLPTRPGALRYSVPHWLQLPPFDRVVAQVVSAHDRHGGGGAYYVWLRRQGR